MEKYPSPQIWSPNTPSSIYFKLYFDYEWWPFTRAILYLSLWSLSFHTLQHWITDSVLVLKSVLFHDGQSSAVALKVVAPSYLLLYSMMDIPMFIFPKKCFLFQRKLSGKIIIKKVAFLNRQIHPTLAFLFYTLQLVYFCLTTISPDSGLALSQTATGASKTLKGAVLGVRYYQRLSSLAP